MSNTVAGGTWSSANVTLATISSTGAVTGVATGQDTIRYIATTATCGNDTARSAILVRSVVSCAAGVSEPESSDGHTLTLYPNPSEGVFYRNCQSPDSEDVGVEIKDITGRLIKELVLRANQETELHPAVPAGVYFLSVRHEQGIINRKIVVE